MTNTPKNQAEKLDALLIGNLDFDEFEILNRRLEVIRDDLFLRAGIPGFFQQLKTVLDYETFRTLPTIDQRDIIWRNLVKASPEWVLPLGYDEVRFSDEILDDEDSLSDSASGAYSEVIQDFLGGNARLEDHLDIGGLSVQDKVRYAENLELIKEIVASKPELQPVVEGVLRIMIGGPQFRTKDGTWHSVFHIYDRLVPEETTVEKSTTVGDWLNCIRENWVSAITESERKPQSSLVSLPGLWLPSDYREEPLVNKSIKIILRQIYQEDKSLREVGWRDLEEIVAELLRGMGLSVHVTKRSWDEGRDVIARGELIPGEPTLLAVEVKHRGVVPVSELRGALWANRQFPALLFATSGRFSAGVFRERIQSESGLRLYLKDGVGLSQWINSYARSREWRKDSD